MENWQKGFLTITWKKYVDLAFSLSQNIEKTNIQFNLIVAIARGGLSLSRLLSEHLQLPIASFTIQSYKNLQQISQPQVTYGLKGELINKKILLTDDVSDTGKTFLRGISYLQELGVNKKNITTCSMHFKPNSQFQPDYFVKKTSKWIIYPYEIRETIESLTKIWQKENISPKEIKHRFSLLHFPKLQIDKYFK